MSYYVLKMIELVLQVPSETLINMAFDPSRLCMERHHGDKFSNFMHALVDSLSFYRILDYHYDDLNMKETGLLFRHS